MPCSQLWCRLREAARTIVPRTASGMREAVTTMASIFWTAVRVSWLALPGLLAQMPFATAKKLTARMVAIPTLSLLPFLNSIFVSLIMLVSQGRGRAFVVEARTLRRRLCRFKRLATERGKSRLKHQFSRICVCRPRADGWRCRQKLVLFRRIKPCVALIREIVEISHPRGDFARYPVMRTSI